MDEYNTPAEAIIRINIKTGAVTVTDENGKPGSPVTEADRARYLGNGGKYIATVFKPNVERGCMWVDVGGYPVWIW